MGVVNYTVFDGEIVSENRDGVEHDYVPDPLGSTVALLDNTQAQTDTFSYWPYGEERTRTGTTATPFRFASRAGLYLDGNGRTYSQGRTYSASNGRWLSTLRSGYRDGAPDYSYAAASPAFLVQKGKQNKPKPKPPKPKWPDVDVSDCGKNTGTVNKMIATYCGLFKDKNGQTNKNGERCVSDCLTNWIGNSSRLECYRDWCTQGLVTCNPCDTPGHSPAECANANENAGPLCGMEICNATFDPEDPCCGMKGEIIGHEVTHCCAPHGEGETHSYDIGRCIESCVNRGKPTAPR